MTITVNTKVYTADAASSSNSIPYLGVANTITVADRFDLYRTPAKATKLFSGVARARVKLTRTLTLTGALTTTGLATIDCAINVPVGAASADVNSMLSDISAGLGQTWAQNLANKQVITV